MCHAYIHSVMLHQSVPEHQSTPYFVPVQQTVQTSTCRQPSFQAIKAIRPRLTLDFHNLGLTLSDGSTIISGVTGRQVRRPRDPHSWASLGRQGGHVWSSTVST